MYLAAGKNQNIYVLKIQQHSKKPINNGMTAVKLKKMGVGEGGLRYSCSAPPNKLDIDYGSANTADHPC